MTNIITNKILNYKHAVNSIYVKEKILFNLNTYSCACEHSPFIDSHHKHNITGDLRFVRNSKLRKLLTKGPNYREPRSTNLNEAFAEITTGFNNCTEKLTSKSKHDVNNFDQWKKAKKQKNVKIETLKTKIKPSFTKTLLPDPDVLAYLESLHRKYVIIPINKASKDKAVICKKFYIFEILFEVGEYNNMESNSAYSKGNVSKDGILKNNENYC